MQNIKFRNEVEFGLILKSAKTVLEEYKDYQENLTSEFLRNIIAEKIAVYYISNYKMGN